MGAYPLKFVEGLPWGRAPQTRWDEVRDQLRARPGQWAEIAGGPAGDPDARRKVRAATIALRRTGFQSAMRTVDGRLIAYARYAPDGEA